MRRLVPLALIAAAVAAVALSAQTPTPASTAHAAPRVAVQRAATASAVSWPQDTAYDDDPAGQYAAPSSPSGVARTQSTAAPAATAATDATDHLYVAIVSVTAKTSDDKNTGMTQSAVQTLTNQLNSYWSEQSVGAVTIDLAGYETDAMNASSCDANTVLSWAEQHAFGGMFTDGQWRGTHEHLVVLTRETCGAKSFATVGGDGGEIFSGNGISSSLGMPYLQHEFGHNLGFQHADGSICRTSSKDDSIGTYSFSSSTCPVTEYDDYLDIMGYTVKGAIPDLSSPQRIMMGWLTDYATADQTTGTYTYRVMPLENSSGLRAIEVTDPRSGDLYYVEFRVPKGRDATSAEFRYNQQCGPLRAGYKVCNLGAGSSGEVRLLRAIPFASSDADGTLAMAVGSVSSDARHTHLNTGSSYTNFDGGFTILVKSHSVSGGAVITIAFHGTN